MIIKFDGTIEKYFPEKEDIPYEILKDAIGGGTLALSSTSIPFVYMYGDDDAYKKNLPPNKNASKIYGRDHEIKGNIILFTVGDEGESLSLTEEVQNKIQKLLESS